MDVAGGQLYRIAAFAEAAGGGNPAGVWVGARMPEPATMLRIAAEVGYSETAFVSPEAGSARRVRYFSPRAEVSFCGHATIAAGAILGAAGGETVYAFATRVGEVSVSVRERGGRSEVSLTSVDTRHVPAPPALLDEALAILGWAGADLDDRIAPALAYAGAWHLVLAAASKGRLAGLDYDFDALDRLMREHDLTTLQLVWREDDRLFHARNPFPVGGVVEDPATGAAAAALGGYLRDAGLMTVPAEFTIRQGEAMGRASVLHVRVPETGGVTVAGSVAAVDAAGA